MDFEFQDPTTQVREAKTKYANFTVKKIGGPKEIIAWRAEQELKFGVNMEMREAMKATAKSVMSLGLPDGDGVTANIQGSTSTRSYLEKHLDALMDMHNYARPDGHETLKPEPEKVVGFGLKISPEPTAIQKSGPLHWIKSFFISFWKSANF